MNRTGNNVKSEDLVYIDNLKMTGALFSTFECNTQCDQYKLSKDRALEMVYKDYNLNVDKNSVSGSVLKSLATKAIREFEKVGFCYVINHGVSDKLIENYMASSRRFFELPNVEKKLYERATKQSYHGWIGMEEESLDTTKPGDLKETFNYYPGEAPEVWPQYVDDFKAVNQSIFAACSQLGSRLLEVLSLGIGLERNFLNDAHQFIGQPSNGTALRSLYYPPLGNEPRIKPGQVRLGEHSDYGTITILFQDRIGGLEVKIPNKGFVPATPIPGAALVNIGDMMQRWTSDRLIATKHRVKIPETDVIRGKPRQSVAFFIIPDNAAMIHCLDGSDKYEPIRAVDYLNYKIGLANME